MSIAHDQALEGMHDVHETSRLSTYVDGLWKRRSYVWHVAVSELRSRQMTSVLGNLWHLLNPLLQVGVYFLVFGLILDTSRGVDNFLAFLTIGVFVFGYSQRCTTAGAKSIVGNQGLLKSMSFPRALLPLTSTLTETLATAAPVGVILAVAIATGETPSLRWLALPVVIAVMSLFNLGTAMIAARATNGLRDIQNILPFVFRILFYMSAVLFSATAYTAEKYHWVFQINPLYCFISVARWSILGGTLDTVLLLSITIWTITMLLGGFHWFRSGEHSYGRG
jgi:teichoic acid transport system permease protein